MMLVVAAVGGATAGVATASRSDDPAPPPSRPLAAAALDALSAPAPPGIVADVRMTNRLLPPAGALAAFSGETTGTLRMAKTGQFRLDLASDAGALELTGDGRRLALYDSRTDTVATMPLRTDRAVRSRGGVDLLERAMGAVAGGFDVSAAEPGHVGGRPAYTVRVTPRDDGGLLGRAELSWDAEAPVPLRLAIHARAEDEPVFELALDEVAYEPVAAADVAPTPHPGAERIDVASATVQGADATVQGTDAPAASGLPAVRRALPFEPAAPPTLAGLPRRAVRLVHTEAGPGALLVYGSGLGAIVVTQWRADGEDPSARTDDGLVPVNIDGATGVEMANPLGTALHVRRRGITYVVAGLVPPIVAERAARELR
jgi:hypothetical protein